MVSLHPKPSPAQNQPVKRSKSGYFGQANEPSVTRKGRNLLHWENIDKETMEENQKKKSVIKKWLTNQIN